MPEPWLTLDATRDVCRKLIDTRGRRPMAAVVRNNETEYMLLFHVPGPECEPYGVLPVVGGMLPCYVWNGVKA